MRVELWLRPLLSGVTPGLAGAQQYSKLLGVVVPFTGWINQSINQSNLLGRQLPVMTGAVQVT